MGPAGAEVLVVDGDSDYREGVAAALRTAGMTPRTSSDGLSAVTAARAQRPDLIVMDLTLRGVDGSSLIALFRYELKIPVVIVTGRSSLHEVVSNLEQGADDYMVKPVHSEELIARIRVILRHLATVPARRATDVEVHEVGTLLVDVGSKRVRVDGREVRLTPREFNLLAHLARRSGRTCTRQEIMRDVWHSSTSTSAANTVNEHIRRLRQKVEHDPMDPERIVTVSGFGYRLDAVGRRVGTVA